MVGHDLIDDEAHRIAELNARDLSNFPGWLLEGEAVRFRFGAG